MSCTKQNCEYGAELGLSQASTDLVTPKHKEHALASVEAFNNYEKSGMWPTAHDEARLAATMTSALRGTFTPQADLEALIMMPGLLQQISTAN